MENTSESVEHASVSDFGPTAPDRFDFTLLFEDITLSLVPSVIFLLSAVVEFYRLSRQPVKAASGFLRYAKLVIAACFFMIQLALLILWTTQTSTLRSQASVPAAALTCVVGLALGLLSNQEHSRSARTSILVSGYLLLTLLFDIGRARTLWLLNDGNARIAIAFTIGLGMKVVFMTLEAVSKRHLLLPAFSDLSPEALSGLYGRAFFSWLNALFKAGFRRILAPEDMFPLDEDMASASLSDRFQRSWSRSEKRGRNALLFCTLWCLKMPLVLGVLPRLLMTGFKFAQPFLIKRTVEYTTNRDSPDNIGWGLIGAFAIVFVGQPIVNATYNHLSYRFITKMRGGLDTLIYSKTLMLSITDLDESAAATLMSTDVEAICNGLVQFHELWAALLESGLALWLLHDQLGVAFVAPAVVSIGATCTILALAGRIGRTQKQWIRGIQTRIDATTQMLNSMKAVKLLGLTARYATIIQDLRVFEIGLSKAFRRLICLRVLLAIGTQLLSPFFAFTVFVIRAHQTGALLTNASAFTSLSLITLASDPIIIVIRAIPMIKSAAACFERVQKYLQSNSRQDHRLLRRGGDAQTPLRPAENEITVGHQMNDLHSRTEVLSQTSPLVIKDASFGWKMDGPPILTECNLTLEPGEVMFVLGPVGSGKSTLLKGILGEVPSTVGFVHVASQTVAYADQTTWVQNGTIQQNIVGCSRLDSAWYKEVVFACGLDVDISNLPLGSSTLVGSSGIGLSGGQKQRLAIARAVYARQDLLILDDVTSGLDGGTEDLLLDRLIGRHGLLRSAGQSLIFATHAVHRKSLADRVLVLENGRLLDRSKRPYSTSDTKPIVPNSRVAMQLQDNGDASTEGLSDGVSGDALASGSNIADRQVGELKTYAYYFSSIGWIPNLLYASMVFLYGGSFEMTQFLITYWTTSISQHGNTVNSFYLGLYAALSGIGLLGVLGLVYVYLLVIVPRSAEGLHARLLGTVLNAPLSFFVKTDTGVTTNRFSQDMNVVDNELPIAMVDLTTNVMIALIGAGLICASSGYFAAVIPFVLAIMWILQKIYLRTSRQVRLLELEAKSPLYTHFIETFTGLCTIRAFGWASAFDSRFLELLDKSQVPFYLLFCIQRWLELVVGLIVAALAVLLAVMIVVLRHSVNPGLVGVALLNIMGFNESLANIIKTWTSLENSFGAIARLKAFSEKTASEHLQSETKPLPGDWPSQGKIEFIDVTARYSLDSEPALKGINITIQPGEKIGVCGRSGSGKSSMAMSLFRMLELDQGSCIRIDGVDLSVHPRAEIRTRLNAVPQDPVFIRGSLRTNLDLSGERSDADVNEALEAVGILATVTNLGGLDTTFDVESFSHGQRQLLCLARAMLRRSAVVVLDEASSSVDRASDELMQRAIRRHFASCTIIAVAHRLETIIDFDKILVLEDGHVVEFDSPVNLLSRDSKFKELKRILDHGGDPGNL